MGAPGSERERKGMPAQHRVKIANPFAIATKKITVAQFRRFLNAHPEIQKRHHYDTNYSPDDDGPILAVTWFEAAQYCNWLSEQEGIAKAEWCYLDGTANKPGIEIAPDAMERTGYRLPTEAEWEFACRAGSQTLRFYGSSAAMLDEYAWYSGTTNGERTWPVGQLKPNDLGLFDVYGNAWEWCQDLAREDTSGDSRAGAQARSERDREVTDIQNRVIRGSSFVSYPSFVHSAIRLWAHAGDRTYNFGLRVARTYR
jgi:formylglycine-generating enzyme required for sulfatase activity